MIKHLSTGAGFLPPTVPPHLFSSSIFPNTKKRGLRESGGTRVGRSFVVIAWNFQGRKKVEIVCFFLQWFAGWGKVDRCFFQKHLGIVVVEWFLMIWFLRFKKVPNSHVFYLWSFKKKTTRRQETCFSLVTDGFTKRSNRILTSYILGFATLWGCNRGPPLEESDNFEGLY